MPWTVWYNDACSDYYTYDMTEARNQLNLAGFMEGPDPPLVPGGDNQRIHPDTGTTMLPLILYIRNDDLDRLAAGNAINTMLNQVGIPITPFRFPLSACFFPVFVNQDYHLYTGAWSLSADPDYLYDLYGGQAINFPNYLYYDNASFNTAAAGIKYPVTFADALATTKEAQLIMTKDVCNIPLWTYVAQTAHKGYAGGDLNKPWHGFVNEEGVGLCSW